MTPAYCSPEQSARLPLSRRTDVWSWGLSVLEMFTGRVAWPSGTVALQALEAFLKTAPEDDLPAMPPSVAEVLRKCFQRSPHARWSNLEEAAERLQTVYRAEINQSYPRQQPTAAVASPRRGQAIAELAKLDRVRRSLQELSAGGHKDLEHGLATLCREKARIHELFDDVPEALALYDESIAIYERWVNQEGRRELAGYLAVGYVDKARAFRIG